MAAELGQLIERYRTAGLTQAAEWLAVAQGGLEAHGLIPPALGESRAVEDTSPPAPKVSMAERAGNPRRDHPMPSVDPEQVASRYKLTGHKDDRASLLALTFDLDRLGLPTRQRNALVWAGFRTVAEVVVASEAGILSSVRRLSERSVREIIERVRAYVAAADAEAAQNGSEDTLDDDMQPSTTR